MDLEVCPTCHAHVEALGGGKYRTLQDGEVRQVLDFVQASAEQLSAEHSDAWDEIRRLRNRAKRKAMKAQQRGDRLAAAERAVRAAGFLLSDYVPATEREADELRRFEAGLMALGWLMPAELAE